MQNSLLQLRVYILTLTIILTISSGNAKSFSKNAIANIIEKVNTQWQNTHPDPGNAFWDNAAYHTGNIEAYRITRNEKFRTYSENWAERNSWKGATSDNKAEWKYKYGEKPENVLFGDWQICFQTYIDLYQMAPDSQKIARALEVMEYQMSTSRSDYWWWVDGLYMVMPVMTKLYKLTGNEIYLAKLNEYYSYAVSILYDQETGLFYRDTKYIFPSHKTVNGKKDFWSRGDGWVFAAYAKVLADLPPASKYRSTFENHYKRLAETIVSCQQQEGYWTRSLLDPDHAPGYETSGTAFYCYGLLWGINNGYLKDKKYTKAALNAWKYLTETAMQPDGKIGYIQPIGEKAIPGQVVNANSTSNFGVGAFLLAASEMYRFVKH